MSVYVFALLTMFMSPCGGEDDTNCYWDAKVQGNHIGWSFIDVGGHAIYFYEVK